jgi:hypothetical protein
MVVVQAWKQSASAGIDYAITCVRDQPDPDSGNDLSVYSQLGNATLSEQLDIFNQGADACLPLLFAPCILGQF